MIFHLNEENMKKILSFLLPALALVLNGCMSTGKQCLDVIRDRENGKLRLIDCHGQFIGKACFDSIDPTGNPELLMVGNNNKVGLIDLSAKIVLPLVYDKFFSLSRGNLEIISKDKKYGLIDYNAKIIVPVIYDEIEKNDSCENEIFFDVRKDGKWGVLDKNGETIISPTYFDINNLGGGMFACQDTKNSKSRLINSQGRIITGAIFSEVDNFYSGYAKFKYDASGKYGIIDRKGKVIAAPCYDCIEDIFQWQKLIYIRKNGKYGYLNDKFEVVISPQFADAKGFYGGIAAIKLKNKWGFINTRGRIVVPPCYDEVIPSRPPIIVKRGNKYGLIDKHGNYVIKPICDRIEPYNAKRSYLVVKGEKYGLFNEKGQVLAPIEYDVIKCLNNNLNQVGINDKTGVIDYEGKWVVPLQNAATVKISNSHFSNLVEIKRGKVFRLLDSTGRFLPDQYCNLSSFDLGMAIVELADSDLFRLIDKQGRYVTPYSFSRVEYSHSLGRYNVFWEPDAQINFADLLTSGLTDDESVNAPKKANDAGIGYSRVKMNGYECFKDSSGKLLFKNRFSEVGAFSDGLAAVMPFSSGGKYHYIDLKGKKTQIPDQYIPCSCMFFKVTFKNGFARFYRKGKWGIINKRGKVVIPAEYNSISFLNSDNFIGYKKKQGLFLIDRNGKVVKSSQFTFIRSERSLFCDSEFFPAKDFSDKLVSCIAVPGTEARKKYGKKRGYMNEKLELVIKPQFRFAGDFEDGRAPVCVNRKWGYINKQGKYVIKPQFRAVGEFYQRIAKVLSKYWGIIDVNGKWMLKPEYRKIDIGNKCIRAWRSNKAYVFNLNGKLISQKTVALKWKGYIGIDRKLHFCPTDSLDISDMNFLIPDNLDFIR